MARAVLALPPMTSTKKPKVIPDLTPQQKASVLALHREYPAFDKHGNAKGDHVDHIRKNCGYDLTIDQIMGYLRSIS